MAHRQLTGKDPDYEFIMALGHGGFGSVAKVRRIRDGKVMACKAIDCRPDPNIFVFATREINTWASFALSEKYIANFSQDVAWTERTKTVRLYMDFYEGGDLQRVIDQCRHEDTLVHPFMATYWSMEVARGVKACHDHGIIHRDLKPANVLLAIAFNYNEMLWALTEGQALTDEQLELAKDYLTWIETRPPWCHITDFGLGKFSNAAHLSGRNTRASFIGTMGTAGFIAPETVAGSLSQNFSMKSDVYSLGCLLYALCSSEAPPPAGRIPLRIPEEFPIRLRNIITRCTEADPTKRPNSREVANEISEAYVDILEDRKFGQMKYKLENACSIFPPQLSGPKTVIIPPEATQTPTTFIPIPPKTVPGFIPISHSESLPPQSSGNETIPLPQLPDAEVRMPESDAISVWSDQKVPIVNTKEAKRSSKNGLLGMVKEWAHKIDGRPTGIEHRNLDDQRSQAQLNEELRIALIKGDSISMDLLIKAGANPRAKLVGGKSSIFPRPSMKVGNDVFHREFEELKSIEERPGSSRLIHFAVFADSPTCCEVLLSHGAKIENDPLDTESVLSPVILAALSHASLVVEPLAKYGYSLDVYNKSTKATPLIFAAMYGRKEVMIKLLDFGASPMGISKEDGNNALLAMIELDRIGISEMTDCARILLTAEPKLVNAINFKGNTPIMLAAKHACSTLDRDLDLVEYLISKGSNPYIKNFQGKDTFQFLEEEKGVLFPKRVNELLMSTRLEPESADMDFVPNTAGHDKNYRRVRSKQHNANEFPQVRNEISFLDSVEQLKNAANIGEDTSRGEPGHHNNVVTETVEYRNMYQGKPQTDLNSLLRAALFSDNANEMDYLIRAGADPRAQVFDDNLWLCEYSELKQMFPLGAILYKFKNWAKPARLARLISFAVYWGLEDCCYILLSHGGGVLNDLPDPESNFYPVNLAAMFGFANLVEPLAKFGYDLNFTNKTLNETPLILSATRIQKDVMGKLLEFGASPNVVDGAGCNALHHLINSPGYEMIDKLTCARLLLETEPKLINVPNGLGYTPIMLALAKYTVGSKGSVEFIDLLIDMGANPYDRGGRSGNAYQLERLGDNTLIAKPGSDVFNSLEKSKFGGWNPLTGLLNWR